MSDHDPGAELARQAADDVAPEVGRFIGTIFGSASIQLDAMLGERVGWWRLRQATRLAAKAQRLLEEAEIKPQQIPFRTSVPLLEAGSLEDDPQLCDRWAALLANAAAEPSAVPASFPAILGELEPDSASMLEAMFLDALKIAPEIRPFFGFKPLEPMDLTVTTKPDEIRFHIDNLIRLGLIHTKPILRSADDVYNTVTITSFGVRFMRACRAPCAAEPEVEWTDRAALQAHIAEADAARSEQQTAENDASEASAS